jgi:hypothetical protein
MLMFDDKMAVLNETNCDSGLFDRIVNFMIKLTFAFILGAIITEEKYVKIGIM